jgi:alpha-amylase
MQLDIKRPVIAVLPLRPQQLQRVVAQEGHYHGEGHDILLQGFHWDSHLGVMEGGSRKPWYRIIKDHAPHIRAAGFTWVWFPPPSDSLMPQGYLPRRWNCLDSAFGSEAELLEAIAALGPVRAMADLILNHRVGTHSPGADFEDPPFPDNRAAVVCDDESGVGTGHPDSGEKHPGGRDLDHNNPDVRATIKNYLKRLQSLGFSGWRYDLAKGYHGRFVAEYNDATRPILSVGEFFDGDRQKITNWIDDTRGRSTAFDFTTRFLLQSAFRHDDYSNLRSAGNRPIPGGLIGFWPSRAITFLENHDTEYRREEGDQYHDPGLRHFPGWMVNLGYAYLLTHPGIPCVFWSHFFEWGETMQKRIERLIRVRKQAGLHATSKVDIKEAKKGLYAAVIGDRVAMKLGSENWWPGGGWHLALDGEKFAVWTR